MVASHTLFLSYICSMPRCLSTFLFMFLHVMLSRLRSNYSTQVAAAPCLVQALSTMVNHRLDDLILDRTTGFLRTLESCVQYKSSFKFVPQRVRPLRVAAEGFCAWRIVQQRAMHAAEHAL